MKYALLVYFQVFYCGPPRCRQAEQPNTVCAPLEMFSNVGRVNLESSLRRFITAKADNDKKTLAWAIVTDAAGVMHVSFRDFRPHVAELLRIDAEPLAQLIAQDCVDSYARGLNQFARVALQIVRVRRGGTFAGKESY